MEESLLEFPSKSTEQNPHKECLREVNMARFKKRRRGGGRGRKRT